MLKKSVFFLSLFSIISSLANAQFKKGMRMVGANVASVLYSSGNADNTVAQIGSNKSKVTQFNLNISPSIGWFVTDQTVVGASLLINPSSNKATYQLNGSTYESDETNKFNIGLGGFARHYFKASGQLIPFGQIGINGGMSSMKTDYFFYGGSGSNAYKLTVTGDSNGGFFFNSTFQAGLTKMIGETTGLDFYIGYNYSYNKNTFKEITLRDVGNDGSIEERGERETTTKFTNHGFLFGIGFQIFLKGKAK